MNNFVKRTFSGFFFVTLIIGSILLSRYYVFLLVFSFITGYTVHEFHKLTNLQIDVHVSKWWGVINAKTNRKT